jgi:hypothetical protein
MAKLLSAVCSALLISFFATIRSYTPASEQVENVYYDSFGHLFVIGLLVLLALYILIAAYGYRHYRSSLLLGSNNCSSQSVESFFAYDQKGSARSLPGTPFY